MVKILCRSSFRKLGHFKQGHLSRFCDEFFSSSHKVINAVSSSTTRRSLAEHHHRQCGARALDQRAGAPTAGGGVFCLEQLGVLWKRIGVWMGQSTDGTITNNQRPTIAVQQRLPSTDGRHVDGAQYKRYFH